MITELEDFDLTHHNTFGMRVKCARWIEYTSSDDLPEIFRRIGSSPFKAIGEGSNLLFEGNYPGALLHSRILDMEAGVDDNGDFLLTAGSGLIFDDVVEHACRSGIWGMENLSAIPGQTGAAAVQNIGAYGVEVADIVDEVRCYDTVERCEVSFTAADCCYGYRMSMFKTPQASGRYIVISVRFRLAKGLGPRLDYGNLRASLGDTPLTPMNVRQAVIAIREAKLPAVGEFGSAGSFFKNPVVERTKFEAIAAGFGAVPPHYDLADGSVKIPAAWLIEQCGFKGMERGNVAVWSRQPLIIVNLTGRAAPDEIMEMQRDITDAVEQRFGIKLHPEVEHVI